ncbi:uncharacterized protein LOC116260916 [Nymphaea colorata]|uniref:Uncharacterized protein n=1 Tax=Nymphaea colorata TaxID=210225 RepID=A0A5K1H409_9MAGN|nr:uncharacterized protein LOC116260916 [Nymphaea colorata]
MADRRPNPTPAPKYLGLVAQVKKRKDSFIQLFLMTGVLLLSMRSVGQKYRIKDLQDDTTALKEENGALASRMESIKQRLLQEAALEPTGFFASKLSVIFNESAPSPSSSSDS